MSALTDARNTPYRDGTRYTFPVAAGVTLYAGALAAVNAAGFATPGAVATGLKCAGRVERTADNSAGSSGDVAVEVRPGIYRWDNSADADEIIAADVGAPCFIVDDQTVAKTDGGAARSAAGVVIEVDGGGVWVACGLTI